jgi:hypothetical protein
MDDAFRGDASEVFRDCKIFTCLEGEEAAVVEFVMPPRAFRGDSPNTERDPFLCLAARFVNGLISPETFNDLLLAATWFSLFSSGLPYKRDDGGV